MGVITEENYSLQAKNLLDSIVEEYLIKIEKLHTDNFYFHELKKMRFKINNRTRKFSDLSEIKKIILMTIFFKLLCLILIISIS